MKWKECAVDVELWDCAGDPKFLDKFAAFTPRSSAVIYVANSELKPETDLDDYQQLFPSLNSNQSSVFVHRGGQASVKKPKFISKILSKSPVVYTSFDMDPEVLKMEFDKLLVNAYTNVLEQGEKEERAIAV